MVIEAAWNQGEDQLGYWLTTKHAIHVDWLRYVQTSVLLSIWSHAKFFREQKSDWDCTWIWIILLGKSWNEF